MTSFTDELQNRLSQPGFRGAVRKGLYTGLSGLLTAALVACGGGGSSESTGSGSTAGTGTSTGSGASDGKDTGVVPIVDNGGAGTGTGTGTGSGTGTGTGTDTGTGTGGSSGSGTTSGVDFFPLSYTGSVDTSYNVQGYVTGITAENLKWTRIGSVGGDQSQYAIDPAGTASVRFEEPGCPTLRDTVTVDPTRSVLVVFSQYYQGGQPSWSHKYILVVTFNGGRTFKDACNRGSGPYDITIPPSVATYVHCEDMPDNSQTAPSVLPAYTNIRSLSGNQNWSCPDIDGIGGITWRLLG